MRTATCARKENFSFHLSSLVALIIKLPQDRLTGGKKKINCICMHRGIIEIGPPKSPKQIVWISFLDNKTIICKCQQNKGACA